jgi:hypothetical protein
MKIWPVAVLALSCLIFSGCRTDPRIALVERDNRRLEDEIYRLRGQIEDYECGAVTTTNDSTTTTRPSRRRDREDANTSRNHDIPPGATTTPPAVEMEETPANEVPGIIRKPGGGPAPANRPGNAPGALNPPRNLRALPGAAGPALVGATEEDASPPSVPAENMSAAPPQSGDSRNAVQIVLHDALCTASEKDGLRVVFEARDRRDRRIDAPANVTIVAYDPAAVPHGAAKVPLESKLVNVQYPAEAVASMFRVTHSGKVMCIDSPWSANPTPQQKQLVLAVRYVTRDGRELIVRNKVIRIQHDEERVTREPPPRRLLPPAEESPGPELVKDDPPARPSTEEDAPPADRREPVRTANRDSAPRLQRPVWSPERR